MSVRVPRVAIDALGLHIERFLRAHGVTGDICLEDTELDSTSLREFLLAALVHAREQHPWLGRQGVVIEAPEAYPAGTAAALDDALPAHDAPLTAAACVAALQRAFPYEVVDAPCGRRQAHPRVLPELFFPLPTALRDAELWDHVHIVVAEARWLEDPTRRDLVFSTILPANDEHAAFIELGSDTARRIAGYLFAGPRRPDTHTAYRRQAAAFVQMFGPATRCFGNSDLEGDTGEDPYKNHRGSSWSRYSESGAGSWGSTITLVVTDGLRAAYLDALWDVTCE